MSLPPVAPQMTPTSKVKVTLSRVHEKVVLFGLPNAVYVPRVARLVIANIASPPASSTADAGRQADGRAPPPDRATSTPSTTLNTYTVKETAEIAQALAGEWRRSSLWIFISLKLLILMLLSAPAARADPLYALVVAGLITTLSAGLVTLAFVTICDLALGLDGVDGARAACNFAKTAATRAGDGSLFTEISVLLAIPEAATRWSLILTLSAYIAWLSKLLHGLVCTPSAISYQDVAPSASAWTLANTFLCVYMLITMAHTAFAVYHFAGAWCEGESLACYIWGRRRVEPVDAASVQASSIMAQAEVKDEEAAVEHWVEHGSA